MYLSGEQIANEIIITPFNAQRLQQASYDMTLGSTVFVPDSTRTIDPCTDKQTGDFVHFDRWALQPDAFVLGHTIESIYLHNRAIARIEGKSSLARWGLLIHATAGFIDPGYKGQLTLEIKNISKHIITLTAGMPVAQLAVCRLDAATLPYNGKYQDSRGVQPSRYYQNFQ